MLIETIALVTTQGPIAHFIFVACCLRNCRRKQKKKTFSRMQYGTYLIVIPIHFSFKIIWEVKICLGSFKDSRLKTLTFSCVEREEKEDRRPARFFPAKVRVQSGRRFETKSNHSFSSNAGKKLNQTQNASSIGIEYTREAD